MNKSWVSLALKHLNFPISEPDQTILPMSWLRHLQLYEGLKHSSWYIVTLLNRRRRLIHHLKYVDSRRLGSSFIPSGVQWEASQRWPPSTFTSTAQSHFEFRMVHGQIRRKPNNSFKKRSFKGYGDSGYGDFWNRRRFRRNEFTKERYMIR